MASCGLVGSTRLQDILRFMERDREPAMGYMRRLMNKEKTERAVRELKGVAKYWKELPVPREEGGKGSVHVLAVQLTDPTSTWMQMWLMVWGAVRDRYAEILALLPLSVGCRLANRLEDIYCLESIQSFATMEYLDGLGNEGGFLYMSSMYRFVEIMSMIAQFK